MQGTEGHWQENTEEGGSGTDGQVCALGRRVKCSPEEGAGGWGWKGLGEQESPDLSQAAWMEQEADASPSS